MVTLRASDGGRFDAYLAVPDGGAGPGVVLIQEIYGVNRVMRETADRLAGKGFVVICPDLFWRQQPGVDLSGGSEAEQERAFALYAGLDESSAVEDTVAALGFVRQHKSCTGSAGALGFCLGGKLAYLLAARAEPDCAVGYYGVGIEDALDRSVNVHCPVMLHLAGRDDYCPPEAQRRIHEALDAQPLFTLHDYPNQGHGFARRGGPHYDAVFAELAELRTLDFLRTHLCARSGDRTADGVRPPEQGGEHDLAALWEEHVRYEFETRDHVDTLKTMVPDAYVNHIPTLTGGVGQEQLSAFYAKRFIPQMPSDTAMTPVSRTVGRDRVVDEMIFTFTHTIEMDWMLPGIAPTGKRVEVPLVAIVHFRDGKLAHEHIYWDQASVLVQLGLLDAEALPVAGVETARKVLDNTVPSNALIERADRRSKRSAGG